MPDLEERFWNAYREQGLIVVALNASDTMDKMGEVESYIGNIGPISYDVGLGGVDTYKAITQNFAGVNPFPVDVLVGKDGKIRYIVREYDPESMTEAIEQLLAE